MTSEPTAHAKSAGNHTRGNQSAAARRKLRALLVVMGIGVAGSVIAGMGEGGAGLASDREPGNGVRSSDLRGPAGLHRQSAASTLDTLERLPQSLRATLQAAKALSSKDLCRVADSLVREPNLGNVDMVAQYLSKDVHRWSDRMVTLYLDADPKLARATDKGEMRKRLLQRWESDRKMVQQWLQGCRIMVRAAIGRSRAAIEREAPEILADVVSVIAIGLRKNEPDAFAAARALARTEEDLRVFLK
jgi:hypothetical protein